jgi:glycosyltransferase involved in cell wall biosynthesis
MAEKHLVLICPEPTRALQQGIGIRFLEMARELRRLGRVSLWVPNEDYPTDYDFEVRRLPKGDLPDAIGGVDAVVIHGHVSDWYFNALRRHQLGEGPPLVVDLYDPFLIENLQYCEELGEQIYWRDRGVLLRQLERGDFFLASSDTQRLFYLGMMIGHGHFALHEYQQDHTLRRLIDVAPFGVRPIAVDAAGTVAGRIKGVVDGIGHADQVLFFGGIYDWYDPELLLDVLDRVIAAAPRLRVIFSSNPNPDTTPQGVFKRVKERSDAAGWTGKYVFFLPWFPYDQRLRYFRDVDLAVSLHRASVETELSLRTRILEYMNMGIPVISTEGGESARLLMTSGGGILVKEGDRAGLAMALVRLLSDEPERRTMGERGRRYAAEWLCWHQTLAPLLRFCDSPRRAARAPAAQPSRPDVGTLYRYWRSMGTRRLFGAALRRLSARR